MEISNEYAAKLNEFINAPEPLSNERLSMIISKLSDRCQEMLYLNIGLGMANWEISEMLDTESHWVAQTCATAKARFRRLALRKTRLDMDVTIYSREEAEALIAEGKFPENTAVISFYDPAIKHINKSYTHIDYSKVCDTVFYSELDDLDLDVLGDRGYDYDTYFSEANDMARFIVEAYNSGRDIICQCEYGQSRSAGCAAAIRQHFYHDGIWVFADFKRYPNQLVFRKLYDALEKIDLR